MFLKNMSLYTGTTPLITFRGIDRCSSSFDTISAQCVPVSRLSYHFPYCDQLKDICVDNDMKSLKYRCMSYYELSKYIKLKI